MHLTPTERFLYAAGEQAVFRFDGETWLALGITFEDDRRVVAPMTSDE